MEELLKTVLLESHGLVAYATVFGVLLACGLGLPLPEDVSLILGGYLAHHGAASLPVMVMVGFVGILAGDSLIYTAGRRIGSKVGQRGGFFARIITPEKREQVQSLFAAHGPKVVMVARFLPGVRAVTYFTAGSAGMSYWRFVFFDGLAALGSAPLFVLLGWKFGDQFDLLVDKIKRGQTSVFIGLGAVLAGYMLLKYWRKRRNLQRAQALLATAQPLNPAVSEVLPIPQPTVEADGTNGPALKKAALDAPRLRV